MCACLCCLRLHVVVVVFACTPHGPGTGCMVVANGGRWATTPSITGSMTIYKGHKCEQCDNCHKKHLNFWPWVQACKLYKTSVGQTRSMLDYARQGRPLSLPAETAGTEDEAGYDS